MSVLPLVEARSSGQQFRTEAGLSYLIKADDITILMDFGRNAGEWHPSPLLENMRTLNVDPGRIDMLVLSHLHPDHTGGGRDFQAKEFRLSQGPVAVPAIPAYVPEPIAASRWNAAPRVEVLRGPKVLAPGIAVTGPIPRHLFLLGRIEENALAVNVEGKGIVLVSGCGHQGVVKLLDRARTLFNEPVYGIVGGLHLAAHGDALLSMVGGDRFPLPGAAERRAREAIGLLQRVNPGFVALSPHDSSGWTIGEFRRAFGDRYHDVEAGRELKL
jgi:7,8-dihydropterin-6-yl-methyl-4-(beta-D-ribofuranosyl)aminobenzene 5'-phosphate synthase